MKIRHVLAMIPVYKMLSQKYHRFLNRERYTTYGTEHPDKIYYIIGQDDRNCGLWWITNKVIMHLAYADKKGYIPIVDYKHFLTQYHNEGEYGKINVWEKFFKQPMGISLGDISRSKNIILSDRYDSPSKEYLMGNTDFYTDKKKREYFRAIFAKYINFSETSIEYLESVKNRIIPENAYVLGVLCRGTDYLLKKPKNHPIQPAPSEVIELVTAKMHELNYDYVFLATEDADILHTFKDYFGEKLLYIDQERVCAAEMTNENKVMNVNIKKNKDRYLMGLKYLSATYILSKCNGFIAGRCGGTKGVLLMTKGFEYEYIYDLGLYK